MKSRPRYVFRRQLAFQIRVVVDVVEAFDRKLSALSTFSFKRVRVSRERRPSLVFSDTCWSEKTYVGSLRSDMPA